MMAHSAKFKVYNEPLWELKLEATEEQFTERVTEGKKKFS